nr:uncharacterized protein LOC113715848 [Coffea arabica]
MAEILEGIPLSINQEMNTNLTKLVEEDEIRVALFSMQPEKAPGQDGLSPLFFQSCLRTVSYSFNCNGETKGFVTPERGVRQGDLLSPYLFLICSEGFSNLLRKAEERKDITGLRISRQGPIISHLFFADDSLIFCKANMKQASEIMKILKIYEETSGQLINLDKSSVFFSKNMSMEQRKDVCNSMGGMAEIKQEKYLGLPMVIFRSKDQIFGFIKENIKRKLQD